MKYLALVLLFVGLNSAKGGTVFEREHAIEAAEAFVSEDGNLGIWWLPTVIFGGCTSTECVITKYRETAKQKTQEYRHSATGTIFEQERRDYNSFIEQYCQTKNAHANPDIYLFDQSSRDKKCADWMIALEWKP